MQEHSARALCAMLAADEGVRLQAARNGFLDTFQVNTSQLVFYRWRLAWSTLQYRSPCSQLRTNHADRDFMVDEHNIECN